MKLEDIELLDSEDRENILNIKLLNHGLHNNSLAHAYLFNGNNYEGLLKTALLFVCNLFCKDGGCLQCKVCKNVLNLKHVDLFLLKPAGSSLSVEEFKKGFEDKINKKATNSMYRVTIIQECESMTPGIADRFLKILEDPPGDDLIFILLSENSSKIRNTIKSRCQILNWHFKSDCSSEYGSKLDEVALNTENLLKDIISKKADIIDVLDFSPGLDEVIDMLSKEMSERHKKEISFIKKSGMDEDYITKLLKEAEESQKREKRKFSNLIIAHVFDIISAYVEDIITVISGSSEKYLNRVQNYREIYNNYYDGNNKEAKIFCFSSILDKIALNRKSLAENINYEIAIDRILTELFYINNREVV